MSGPHVEIVGGGPGGENDAIDAFLQSLGMQMYGPQNVYNSTYANIWQVTPNDPTLSGSWDIRSYPSIGYLFDSGGSGGWGFSQKAGWDPFYLFNYGGGSPVPADTQADNLGIGSNQADVDAHPDWWAQQPTTNTISAISEAASVMPLGTVNVGDTFAITLTNPSLVSETITITANSSDNSASGIATALYNYIHADVTDAFFENTSITVTTNSELNTNSSALSYNNPTVEFWPAAKNITYTIGVKKNTTVNDPNFLASVYKDNELNFTNANLVNAVVNGFVAGWVAGDPAPGSMLTMSPRDGGNYDHSVATISLMHANDPYQTSDVGKDWQGYNQNGVLVDASSESYWALVNAAAKYVLQHETAGEDLMLGALAYSSTAQPPSFALEPNIFMEPSEIFQDTSDTIDEQLKIDKSRGAITGLYRNWNIYLEGYYGNPVAQDQQPSYVDTQMVLFNDDHVFALAGEDAPSYGGQMPGYYMAQLISANPANANATTMQNALTAYYNSSFGPAATAMEDDFVMFMGSAADPSLPSPPAMATFSGFEFGAFGETGALLGEGAVANDDLILQKSFGYLDSASSALLTAYNSGHNASFTLSQYNAAQDRVDQLRMYDEFLFLEYKIESDYYNLGVNKTPTINSASFNLIMNDLYNEVYWVNDLINTGQIDTANFDEYFAAYTYKNLSYFTANDPNGSNGIKTDNKGLLRFGGGTPDPTPTQTTINNDWSADEAILAISAPPSNIAATVASATENDLTWTNNAVSPDGQTGLNINRAVNSGGVPGAFSLLTSVAATVTSYHDTSAISGTTYWYEIQSFNTSGNSIFDGPIQPSASTLTAPNSLSASAISTTEIGLSWNNTNTLQTGVYVDRSTDGTTYLPIATLGATATAYTDSGLTDGSLYYYEVQAFDPTSTSGNSSVASAVTVLAAPSSLAAAAVSPSEIDINWTNNSATQAGFNIDRSTDDAVFIEISTVSSSTTTFSDTALTADTTFYYEVEAFNTAAGDSAFSNVASAATSSSMAAPSSLTATAASNTQINLAWTNNDGGSATGYDIDQSTTGFSGWSQIATVASGVHAYTNTGLSEGIQYFYEVQAFNGTTTSGFSATANTVTTLAAPSALSATTASTSQINLSWTDNDGGAATGYNIDRSTTSTGGFTQIATVGAGVSAYTNTGLTDGSKFFYEVDAVDAFTTSAFSNIANAVTQLAAPSGLAAAAGSTTSINLSCTDNDAGVATAYNIDRSTTSTGGFSQIATVGSGATAYTNTGLAEGALYFYEVDASDALTTSAFSSIANAVTTLAAPSGLSASAVSISQINLTWTDNDGGAATAYDIDRSTNSTTGFAQIATVGTGATAYTNTGLSEGTKYYYEILAANSVTTSAFSAVTGATTTITAPSGLSATTASTTQINLGWTNNDAGTATAYDIDRSTTSTGGFAQIATVGAGVTAYTNTGLTDGTQYFYEVAAADAATTSAFSNIANAITTLAAPSALTATEFSPSQVNLKWTDNDSGVATAYDIDRSTTNTSGFSQIGTAAANATSYNDSTGLSSNTTYYYEVDAVNAIATSAFSNIANATTSTTLAAPSSLTATAASTSQINLAWTDNDLGTATSYDIDRSTTSTGGFTQIATVGAGVAAYTNTGLTDGTQYFYEVDAVAAFATSNFSNIANAVTNLSAPSGLSATEVSAGQINLAWTNNSSTYTGVDIDRSTDGTTYAQIATVATAVTSYHDTPLYPSTKYYYEVKAFNAITTSAFSSAANATTPTNEVGGVGTDYWYGTNGSAWSTQWSFVDNTSHASTATTLSGNQGSVAMTYVSGSGMGGQYYANLNTMSVIDSFQSVLVQTNTTSSQFELNARYNGSNWYQLKITFEASGNDLLPSVMFSAASTR